MFIIHHGYNDIHAAQMIVDLMGDISPYRFPKFQSESKPLVKLAA